MRRTARKTFGDTQRLLALGLAFLCVLGQISSLVHLFVVQHAICPEHGELVETGEVGQAAPMLPAEPSLARRAEGAADSHDHCLAYFERRAGIEEPSSLGAPSAPPEEPPQRIALPLPLPPPLPTILTAPKNSPPA